MYISNGQHYTYGVKSWNDIFNISNPEPWSTVFCSDNYRVWWYHEEGLWMTNDCVLMDVDTSNGFVVTGTVVTLATSAPDTCERVTTSGVSAQPLGVVLDVTVGRDIASVAMTGKYKGNAGDTIVVTNGLRADTTDGTFTDSATANGSSNIGVFANALESGSDGDLLWIHLFPKREFY